MDSIPRKIANSDKAFALDVQRHELARRAIKMGVPRAKVIAIFELSRTAYERLAGQVRGAN